MNRITRLFSWMLLMSLFAALGFPAHAGSALTVLEEFDGANGAYPDTALIQSSDGNFYGTTEYGGPADAGNGTVFKLSPAGTLTTLYTFSPITRGVNSDGADPNSSLVEGSDGDFYGTTSAGGVVGQGTVFKITPDGAFTLLATFTGTDGSRPEASLVQGSDGNFYGTTYNGGIGWDPATYPSGYGTVFKITPSGTLTTLHLFAGEKDGGGPSGSLMQYTDGNFYGTTAYGTIFKITPAGVLTTLHTFTGVNEGSVPSGPLTLGSDGDFYGTTVYGGGAFGTGTVYKITPSGALTTLTSDVAYPDGGVIQGTDGNFYGTFSMDGEFGTGSVFQMTPAGLVAVLYGFSPYIEIFNPTTTNMDGADPRSGVILGSDGNLYGTAPDGGYGDGTNGYGTIFEVSLHLAPPSITAFTPASGQDGTTVTITGKNLNEVSAVRFNGANAIGFIGSTDGTTLTATVPVGALSGKIRVTTTTGSLQTATPFTVLATPPPTINALYGDNGLGPASGLTGGNIFIEGTGLYAVTSITIGGIPATDFYPLSATELYAVVPNAAPSGPDFVTVTSASGTATSPMPFTVTGGAPIPQSFTPASGPAGTVVTITGQRLSGVTAVRFNSASATVFSVNSAGTQIKVTVAAGADPGKIEVTTPLGATQTPAPFLVTMTAYPTILSFSPASGPVGTPVTITGTNLTGTSLLGFMGQHAKSFTVNAAGTQITTTVPAGAMTGPISALTPAGETASAMNFGVTP